MSWRVGTDAVVTLRLAFVVFVVFGGFAPWRWPAVWRRHFPAALYASWRRRQADPVATRSTLTGTSGRGKWHGETGVGGSGANR